MHQTNDPKVVISRVLEASMFAVIEFHSEAVEIQYIEHLNK